MDDMDSDDPEEIEVESDQDSEAEEDLQLEVDEAHNTSKVSRFVYDWIKLISYNLVFRMIWKWNT